MVEPHSLRKFSSADISQSFRSKIEPELLPLFGFLFEKEADTELELELEFEFELESEPELEFELESESIFL